MSAMTVRNPLAVDRILSDTSKFTPKKTLYHVRIVLLRVFFIVSRGGVHRWKVLKDLCLPPIGQRLDVCSLVSFAFTSS